MPASLTSYHSGPIYKLLSLTSASKYVAAFEQAYELPAYIQIIVKHTT